MVKNYQWEKRKCKQIPFNDMYVIQAAKKGKAEMIEILIKIKSHRKVGNSIKGNAT